MSRIQKIKNKIEDILVIQQKRLLFAVIAIVICSRVSAQVQSCIFIDTLFRIDFGNNKIKQEFNLNVLQNYELYRNDCPPDGFYSYSSQTRDCFNQDWITLYEDHTPGDVGGKMFFVNASPQPSTFFITALNGFKPNTTYEFGIWMLNLCKVNGGCSPLPPNVLISIQTMNGTRVSSFKTGQLLSNVIPAWEKYYALFTTPADAGSLILKMEDLTNGTCGNDFAMDDITFRECYKIETMNSKMPLPEKPSEEKPKSLPKMIINPPKEPAERLKKENVILSPKTITVPATKDITRLKTVAIPIPDAISSRENPVIKEIKIGAGLLKVELYDNGQVDGDTVSIYHNNVLIMSKAGLSEKAITFSIDINVDEPHHELIMVANNLGSIPPNTSLMILTAKGKRYEIFISSSEQKNAKIIIDLEH